MSLWITDYVAKNKYSRPAFKLLGVKGIVMHWTANLGATDTGHKNFFDGSDGGGSRYASAHIFIDKDSATLIVPLNEVAYHANEKPSKIAKLRASASYYQGGNANLNTIGIEMCVEKDGSIHSNTIARSVKIVAELCKLFKLNPLTDVYRHFDVTGKNCPAPWVKDSSKFVNFKNDVKKEMTPVVASKPTSKPAVDLKAKTHTVEKGETFYSISKDYNIKLDDLMKYNARVDADDLKVGDVIHLVPFPQASVTPAKPTPTPTKPKPTPKPVPSIQLSYSRTLKQGLQGADVRALQTALNKLKFNVGTVDGDFGAKTKDAVERFQKVHLPYEVDGIAGRNTINKINSLLK